LKWRLFQALPLTRESTTLHLPHIGAFHILTMLLDVNSAVPNLAASTSSLPFSSPPRQKAFIATKINHKQKLK
jgi:hypothetical protein